MRITVLGCWAPYPAAGGACSSYLVETGSSNILLEVGHGSFSQLQGVIDFRKLDMIILSHLHPDHWGDLSCVRHAVHGAINDGSRQGKLPVYLPNEPVEEYRRSLKMNDGLEILQLDDSLYKEIKIPGGKISFFKVNHPLLTFGTVIQTNNNRLVYSADTGESSQLVEVAQGCDLLICEASLMEKDKAYGVERGHLTAAQAAAIAKDTGAKKLLLTHLWPEYDLVKLHNEAKEIYPEAILAKNRLVLEI